LPLLAEQRAR
jgi:hypothetical protein